VADQLWLMTRIREEEEGLRVGSCKSTSVDLGLSSRVKSICNGAAVGISWRSRFQYKSTCN